MKKEETNDGIELIMQLLTALLPWVKQKMQCAVVH